MKVFEILRTEKENKDCCYLIKDGIFWRAWERSAMQFCETIKTYKVIKKRYKNISTTMVYIGFPDINLESLLDSCIQKGLKPERQTNLIRIAGFDPLEGFDQWKDSIIMEENISNDIKVEYTKTPEKVNHGNIGNIEKQIIRFPVANKTPLECQQFIHELQSSINESLR